MDNFSKDDIDFIFKEGTDKQEFPFNDSSWNNMEQMLDAEDKKRRYNAYIFLSLVVLFISVAVFFGINHFSSDNQNTNSIAPLTLDDKHEFQDPKVSKTEELKIKVSPTNQKLNKLSKQQKTSIEDPAKSSIDKNRTPAKNIVLSNQSKSLISNSISNKEETIKTENLLKSDQSNLIVAETNTIQANNTINTIGLSNEPILSNTAENKIEILNIRLPFEVSAIPSLDLNNLQFSPKPITTKNIVIPETKNTRFAYRALLAHEASFVRGTSTRKSGFKIGAEVAYQFGNRFQISSGLSISLKKYETAGTNYSPVQARIQWVDDVPPETVQGKCAVIEIPLEFTYYLKNYRESGFFIGAGINSYLLTNEWYDFEFDNVYKDLNDPFWTTKDRENMAMKQHYLSILTAQVGYQHQVSRKLAFQIAPYVQLPFTGIGYGDVNLISTGVQFKMSFSK